MASTEKEKINQQIIQESTLQSQCPEQKPVSLRELYLQIPKEISKYLVEAGITSLLNCIETQKKMILGIHYTCKKLCQNFNPEGPEVINTYNAIKELIAGEYLKQEIKNFENNSLLYEKFIKKIEYVYQDVKNSSTLKKINKILKFLKGGMVNFNEPRTSKIEDSFKSRDEENDIFRSFYGLKEHDIIDEAEDIATHLMNEVYFKNHKIYL